MEESSFLPPEMQSYPSPHGEGLMLVSSKCIFPQLLPKMQRYPFPQILSHIYMLERIFPSSKCKTLLILPYTNSILYRSLFHVIFVYLYISSFFIIISFDFSFFFSPKLGILSRSRKIIPQRLRRIIE